MATAMCPGTSPWPAEVMQLTLPSTPSFRLDGRHALVAGAGRGIGMAAAAALADAGARVTLAARSRDELEALAAALRERGAVAHVLTLDVTDSAAVAREVAARYGRPSMVTAASLGVTVTISSTATGASATFTLCTAPLATTVRFSLT